MSAPKPRVWWDTDLRMWREECACGYAGRSGHWRRVIDSALEHSRTHTAERIAEHLEARSREHRREGWHMENTPMMRSYWLGRDSGTRYAAHLIRQHLVKETR